MDFQLGLPSVLLPTEGTPELPGRPLLAVHLHVLPPGLLVVAALATVGAVPHGRRDDVVELGSGQGVNIRKRNYGREKSII